MWNSLESDTESLAQERIYQMALQKRIQHANSIVNPVTGGDTDRQSEEEEDGEDDLQEDEEENYIYDSLDIAAHRLGKRNPSPNDTEVRKTGKDIFRHSCEEDEYAALRYDPNWRSKLKGPWVITEGRNQVSLEEAGSRICSEPCDERPWNVGDHSQSEGEATLSAGSQAPGFPPTPYYLSQQNNSVIRAQFRASKLQIPCEPLDGAEGLDSVRRLKAIPATRNPTHTEENQTNYLETEKSYEEVNEMYTKEYQLMYKQESAHTDKTMDSNQDVHHKPKQSHRLSNMKPARPNEDIVQRNKMTLGVRTKQGSYLCAHGQKKAKYHEYKESEAVEDINRMSSQGSQNHHLGPELKWQQKTQWLKVHREKKKGRREGNDQCSSLPIARTHPRDQAQGVNPSIPQDGRAGVEYSCWQQQPGHAEILVIGETGPSSAVGTPPSPQWRPDCSPYTMKTPTLNLNISLKASTDMPPFLGGDPQQTSSRLSDFHSPSKGTKPAVYNQTPISCHYDPPVNQAQPAYYSPGYLMLPTIPQAALSPMAPSPKWLPGQQNNGKPFQQQEGRGRHSRVPPLWDHGSYSVCTRITPPKWPAAEQSIYLIDQDSLVQSQESQRLSHRIAAKSSVSYTVLPPIEKTVANDSELSSQNPGQRVNPFKRSSSEGYLAQLERQKQLKDKTAYKAYTLKDYKALKQDVKLGGLGPNYKVKEITAEKIRRQKKYSDKVRDHNKTMNRIPFLPGQNRGDRDTTEDVAPRRKALEYARSIPKPKPPTELQDRERAGKEDFLHEHVEYMQHLDLAQLSRLEMLQKRHEEEKQNSVN